MLYTEHDRMFAARRASLLRQDILRVGRRPADTLSHFLLAECELEELASEAELIRKDLEEYDARVNPDRKGKVIHVHSGRRFWPEDPRPDDIDVRDIAHALARTNRFIGHTKTAYNVAQHSVLVSRILPARLKLFGLLHDAGEAYLGDIASPVKSLLKDRYDPLEEKIMEAVAVAYGFTEEFRDARCRELVKRADRVLLVTEARDLTTSGFIEECVGELPLDEEIRECWGAEEAEDKFLFEFHSLTGPPF